MKKGLNKDQRGLAPMMLVVVIVVIAAVVGAGYFIMQKNKDTSQSAEQKAAASVMMAACEKEVGDKDFCKYTANIGSLYSYGEAYTAVSTSNLGGEASTSTIRSDGKGNVHMISDSSFGATETITLNGTTYSKSSGEDVWYRMPSAESTIPTTEFENSEISYNFDETDTEHAKTIYKNLGKEPCGNLTCIKYQTYSQDSPDETWTVWFDDKDFKTRRTEISADDYISTTVYTYEAVTINEPSPVQDMPDYGNMSTEELQRQMQQFMND